MLVAFLVAVLAPAAPAEGAEPPGNPASSPTAVCPLAPAPPPAAPPAVTGGVPPAPQVLPAPATVAADDDIVVQGLLLRAQADGGYLVFDLANRHVGTIRPDGSLADAEPFRRPGTCDRVPIHGGPDPECMLEAPLLTNQGQTGRASGVGDAALAVIWALARGARQASRNPRARGETPAPLPQSVRQRTAPARTRIARRHHVALYCEALTGLGRSLGRVHRARQSDPAAQRAALFRLWDAVDERFPRPRELPRAAVAEVEQLRTEAIAHGRALVEQFARARHPQGGQNGFTTAELRELNRTRRAAVPFDPYGVGAP